MRIEYPTFQQRKVILIISDANFVYFPLFMADITTAKLYIYRIDLRDRKLSIQREIEWAATFIQRLTIVQRFYEDNIINLRIKYVRII